jgi:hypothetical protein
VTAARVFALAALVAVAAPRVALGHEIGTTQVTVRLHGDRTYAVDVVTDAEALLDKLEAVAQRRGPKPLPAELATRLAALESTFRDRVAVAFDGRAVPPSISVSVSPKRDELSPTVATIRLTGVAPAGATHVTWTYGWTFASYALSVTHDGEDSGATQWLEGGDTSTAYDLRAPAPPMGRAAIAEQYFLLGLTHIVPKGLDHVLFVLGLFLLGRNWRSVLWQVSAFTVAHSITLGLSMYGLIGAPPSVVEPLIAVSIAYVAIENLVLSELKPWRVALVFAFGLLHGMGFAGVLAELGLPRGEFLTALVTFNVGVEAGQLLVIATAFALVGWYRADASYRRHVVLPASLAIACTAVYWTIARLPL